MLVALTGPTVITQPQIAPRSVLDRAAVIFDRLDVSESTRQGHQWHIAEFVRFMDGRQLTSNSYLEYKRYLADRTDLAVTTKNRYLGSASVLLKELAREGVLPRDFTLNVHYFQQSKLHKREGITNEEMHRLVDHMRELLDADPALTTRRDWALLALLGFQGLRQIEAQRLDVSDLDLIGRTALVQGKGRDDKEAIDLIPQTVDALRQYLAAANIASGPVFPNGRRGPRRKHLTTRAMYKIVTEAFAAAGIEHKTPHGLRHWFTTRLLSNHPGDLLEIRRYTRHSSTQMLGIYDDRIRQKADLHNFVDAFAGFTVGGKR